MTWRAPLAALALLIGACASDAAPEVSRVDPQTVSDCDELERLASAEVDRIKATDDAEAIAEATVAFHAAVTRIESICG